MNTPVLNEIRATTFSVASPDQSATYFNEWFDYKVVQKSVVSEELATLWGAPKSAGRKMITLQPESGAESFLRFIEAAEMDGYAPLLTHGWNAAELHVQDVDGLAARLQNSPFKILGMPRDLNEAGAVRAMQVLCPQNELLYLTAVTQKGYQRTYGKAESPVDRLFIIVLGAADYDATVAFYSALQHKSYEYGAYPVTVLAKAHGLDPAKHKFRMATVRPTGQYCIEIDDYPDCATDRPVPEGGVPAGIGIVSFTVKNLDTIDLPFRAPSREIEDAPIYNGKRAAITVGPSGEWIELIEG